MKNQPAVDLSVQYVTDLSQEYPDLSVGIVRSSENLAGGQVVVVMDSETADLIARLMIAETAKTDTTVDDKLWIRAGLDMMTAAALAPLRAPVVPQIGVLIDLPVSAADLDARDHANVTGLVYDEPTAVRGHLDDQGRPATIATPLRALRPCHTCNNGTTRETVGMICRTCGTDYGSAVTL